MRCSNCGQEIGIGRLSSCGVLCYECHKVFSPKLWYEDVPLYTSDLTRPEMQSWIKRGALDRIK